MNSKPKRRKLRYEYYNSCMDTMDCWSVAIISCFILSIYRCIDTPCGYGLQMSDKLITGYVLKKSFDRMVTCDYGTITIYRNYNRKSMVPVNVIIDKDKSDRMRKLSEFIHSPYYDLLTDEMRDRISSEIKDTK